MTSWLIWSRTGTRQRGCNKVPRHKSSKGEFGCMLAVLVFLLLAIGAAVFSSQELNQLFNWILH